MTRWPFSSAWLRSVWGWRGRTEARRLSHACRLASTSPGDALSQRRENEMSAGECRKKLTIFSKNAEGRTDAAQMGHMDCQGQVSETFCCLSLEMGISPGPCEDATAAITQQLN